MVGPSRNAVDRAAPAVFILTMAVVGLLRAPSAPLMVEAEDSGSSDLALARIGRHAAGPRPDRRTTSPKVPHRRCTALKTPSRRSDPTSAPTVLDPGPSRSDSLLRDRRDETSEVFHGGYRVSLESRTMRRRARRSAGLLLALAMVAACSRHLVPRRRRMQRHRRPRSLQRRRDLGRTTPRSRRRSRRQSRPDRQGQTTCVRFLPRRMAR